LPPPATARPLNQFSRKFDIKFRLKLLLTPIGVKKSVWLINAFITNVVKREQPAAGPKVNAAQPGDRERRSGP